MTEIAAQLSILAAAQINGIPTNMSVELGEGVTGLMLWGLLLRVDIGLRIPTTLQKILLQ